MSQEIIITTREKLIELLMAQKHICFKAFAKDGSYDITTPPLPASVKLPSEEEIQQEIDALCRTNFQYPIFKDGANYIINLINKQL